MPTNIISPTASELMLHELMEVKISTTESRMLTRLKDSAGTAIFETVMIPDSHGLVSIRDLATTIETELGDDICRSFTLECGPVSGVNMTSKVFWAFQSSVDPGIPTTDFLEKRFLTSLAHERDTDVSRRETLSSYEHSTNTCDVLCTYLTDNLTLETRQVSVSPSQVMVPGSVKVYDVSASNFDNVSGMKLIGYTVTQGQRSQRYRVLLDPPHHDPAFIFRNSFGAWETIYMCGERTDDSSFTRSSTFVMGRYETYDVQEVKSMTVSTGPMRYGGDRLARDFARSRAIFLMKEDGSAAEEMTVTDCTVKASNADDATPVYSFTLRPASRFPLEKAPAKPYRIFDYTFDETYE